MTVLPFKHYSDAATDERNVEGLPLIRSTRLFGRRSEKPIHAAGVVTGRLSLRLGFDLYFVAPAQIDPAVGILAAVELHVQLEILELRVTDNLGAVARSNQGSILHGPFGRAGLAHLPAGEIFALEELDGLAPLGRSGLVELRRTNRGPRPRFAIGTVECARKLLAGDLSLEDKIAGAAFLLLGRDKCDAPVGDFNLGERASVAPATDHPGLQLATGLLHFEPGGIFLV